VPVRVDWSEGGGANGVPVQNTKELSQNISEFCYFFCLSFEGRIKLIIFLRRRNCRLRKKHTRGNVSRCADNVHCEAKVKY
jgi:hypothetical protein